MTDLTQETARIRGAVLSPGAELSIAITNVGEVKARVIETRRDGAVLSLDLKPIQFDALLRRLYSQGEVPSVTRTRIRALVGDALARIT